MTDKNQLYNKVLSLIEEELYLRMHPVEYNNNHYDGTNRSICGNDNLDVSLTPKDDDNNYMAGGGFKTKNKVMPGKIDVVRNSFNLPLDIAIKGTLERQRLFKAEK